MICLYNFFFQCRSFKCGVCSYVKWTRGSGWVWTLKKSLFFKFVLIVVVTLLNYLFLSYCTLFSIFLFDFNTFFRGKVHRRWCNCTGSSKSLWRVFRSRIVERVYQNVNRTWRWSQYVFLLLFLSGFSFFLFPLFFSFCFSFLSSFFLSFSCRYNFLFTFFSLSSNFLFLFFSYI